MKQTPDLYFVCQCDVVSTVVCLRFVELAGLVEQDSHHIPYTEKSTHTITHTKR